MIEFDVRCNTRELEQLLQETISPRSYWLHSHIGGSGWSITNTQKAVKTVKIENDQLATFVRLKIR